MRIITPATIGRLAILASALVLAACNEELGPPDGTACTNGYLTPGDSVTGKVTSRSCQLIDAYNEEFVHAESWALNAEAHTAYIVRLRHLADGHGDDNLSATLSAYARNPQGDPVFATGSWGDFGATNGNGGENLEMLLVADQARSFSIRIAITDPGDSGRYSLSVEPCPLRALEAGNATSGIKLQNGCLSEAYYGTPMRMNFLTFSADTIGTWYTSGSRIAGEGAVYAHVSGPDLDTGCYTDDCTWSSYQTGAPDFEVASNVRIPGRFTLALGVMADSSATVTTALGPLAAPGLPATARRN